MGPIVQRGQTRAVETKAGTSSPQIRQPDEHLRGPHDSPPVTRSAAAPWCPDRHSTGVETAYLAGRRHHLHPPPGRSFRGQQRSGAGGAGDQGNRAGCWDPEHPSAPGSAGRAHWPRRPTRFRGAVRITDQPSPAPARTARGGRARRGPAAGRGDARSPGSPLRRVSHGCAYGRSADRRRWEPGTPWPPGPPATRYADSAGTMSHCMRPRSTVVTT